MCEEAYIIVRNRNKAVLSQRLPRDAPTSQTDRRHAIARPYFAM